MSNRVNGVRWPGRKLIICGNQVMESSPTATVD